MFLLLLLSVLLVCSSVPQLLTNSYKSFNCGLGGSLETETRSEPDPLSLVNSRVTPGTCGPNFLDRQLSEEQEFAVWNPLNSMTKGALSFKK